MGKCVGSGVWHGVCGGEAQSRTACLRVLLLTVRALAIGSCARDARQPDELHTQVLTHMNMHAHTYTTARAHTHTTTLTERAPISCRRFSLSC